VATILVISFLNYFVKQFYDK